MDRNARSLTRFALLAGLALGVVLGLVWTMVLRERGIRRLYLEYEAYRASTVLAESFRQNPGLLPADDRVLGFGIYGPDGSPLLRSGTAPAYLDLSAAPGRSPPVRIGPFSLIMERPLGPEAAGMPGMRFMMRGRGPGSFPPGAPRPQFRGQLNLQEGPLGPGLGLTTGPAALWLEYGIGSYARQRAALFGGALLATFALLGFFILLLRLYGKNAELREAEIQTRELVQLGEAARTLVHEIKNPLGVIRVQAATLRRLGDSEAAQKARAKALLIDDEVVRLAGLADRIREFLKGGEGEAREIELSSWLRDFAARYAGELVLTDRDGEASAWVRVDPERLSLALDNVVRNALEVAPTPPPELALLRKGKQWELSVGDRGAGIGADVAARIFEPFFTTKERGTGIGLALARRIARSSGGELIYRARPGGGSLFVFSLPALRHT